MSVDGNSLFGEIPSGVPCFMVAKAASSCTVSYYTYSKTTGHHHAFLNAGPVGDGQVLVAPVYDGHEFTMATSDTAGIFGSGNVEINDLGYAGVSEGSTPLLDITASEPCKFKVKTKMNVPCDKIYSGVWYTLHTGCGKKVSFDIHGTDAGGWLSCGQKVDLLGAVSTGTLEVSFIPYSTLGSVWTHGKCSSIIAPVTSFMYFDSWVRRKYNGGVGEYEQSGCNGKLGAGSKHCIFSIGGCNQDQGGRYCRSGEHCGECFGTAEDGGICTVDNTGAALWYARDHHKTGHGRSTGLKPWEWVLLVVLLLVVVGFGVWLIGTARLTRE